MSGEPAPIHLWIDGQCLQTASRFRGIGRYVTELVAALAQRPDVRLTLSFNLELGGVEAALDVVRAGAAAPDVRLWHSMVPTGEMFTGLDERRRISEIALAHHVACLGPDVAISASPFEGGDSSAVPFQALPGFPAGTAAIFYDAIPHRYAAHYLTSPARQRLYARRLAFHRDVDVNLAISSFCADEAEELFPGVAVSTIWGGVSSSMFTDHGRQREKRAFSPYVLYIGGLDWRKNVPSVVDAFARLPQDMRAYVNFVLAGKNGAAEEAEIRERWRAVGLAESRLIMTGHVSDAELVTLLQDCEVLVQPSFMEGFGLTAAEAMAMGVPVVAARAGALPEVVGKEDCLFDPERPEELAILLRRMLDDADYRSASITHGLAHVRNFTWQRTAEAAVAACRAVVARKHPEPFTIDQARRWSLERVGRSPLPSSWIAGVMARAEQGALEQA